MINSWEYYKKFLEIF
ncbi:TPA: hypothetical protein R9A11_000652 [Campylobacter jejuni]|nr:hypothetical protein [Campylobacter jejuni]HEF3157138.1 hypothetical protein [Campylobacter jejuni]HEF3248214.1 hypothetical protein [Campylobacter jejuni]